MFPHNEEKPASGKHYPMINDTLHDTVRLQNRKSAQAQSMQAIANQASPPGTIITNGANNIFVIDQNGFAVPMRVVPHHVSQIPCEIPGPPKARKKTGFYHVSPKLGENPRSTTLMQYHSEVMQAAHCDRFHQCSTFKRYSSPETRSIQNSGGSNSRRSHGSGKLMLQADPKGREWLQNERTRRDMLNGRSTEPHMKNSPQLLAQTASVSDRSHGSGRSSSSVSSYASCGSSKPKSKSNEAGLEKNTHIQPPKPWKKKTRSSRPQA